MIEVIPKKKKKKVNVQKDFIGFLWAELMYIVGDLIA